MGRRDIDSIQRDLDVTADHGYRGHVMCGRKVRYRTQKRAMNVAKRRMRAGVPYLRAYKCPYCGGWHLTKKEAC